jgi:hypothetical protein
MFWKKKTPEQIQDPMLIALRVEDAESTLAVHADPVQLVNPSEAGLMLADIGRHMAKALANSGNYQGNEEQAFTQIVTMFNAEANAPTQPVQQRNVQ